MNIVLIIAWVLALISAIVVPPDSAYLSYIDFHTLGLLFCLMAVMAGANRLGVFRQAADRLLTKIKQSPVGVDTCFFMFYIQYADYQ